MPKRRRTVLTSPDAMVAALSWIRARMACEELPEVGPAGQPRIDFSSMSPEDRAALRPILERWARRLDSKDANLAQQALDSDKHQDLLERYESRMTRLKEKQELKERKAEEVLQRARELGIDLT